MPDSATILVILTIVATMLVAVGLVRGYAAAKRKEPQAAEAVALAAFHLVERELAEKRAAASAAIAEADAAATRLANLRAQVSGATSVPAAPGT